MKTFLLSAVVVLAVEAANKYDYATVLSFPDYGCNPPTTVKPNQQPKSTTLMIMDFCSSKSKMMFNDDGNFTITRYADENCTESPNVIFSAPGDTCGDFTIGPQSAVVTAGAQSFDESCTLKFPPYQVTYQGSSCDAGAVVTSVIGQAQACDSVGEKSIQATCSNGTVQTCIYDQPDCKGTFTCTPGEPANKCITVGGVSTKHICPGTGVADFCPAHNTPNNKPKNDDIGGIVAGVVIVIIIVIVVVVVIAYFMIKKNKESQDDSGLMDGSETTYGAA